MNASIAQNRYTIPGAGISSPLPHHSICFVEDLAMHPSENANLNAEVPVKLVSEVRHEGT